MIFHATGLFTFTISWARIPPTTAHTGAISEKQYLKEKNGVLNMPISINGM